MATPRDRCIGYTQNFLHSGQLVDELLRRSSLTAGDDVLEIGPGRGIITERLARLCRSVVAVEKDQELAGDLRHKLRACPNVAVHAEDFLRFRLPTRDYKVFASIPFNITAAIVERLTSESPLPADAYLIVQREAAYRFLGEPSESLRSILLKPWFEPTILYQFRRSDFVPRPGVDVVMLRLRKRGPPFVSRDDTEAFRDFVTYTFTALRPSVVDTLATVFSHRAILEVARDLALGPTTTPTQLTLQQWLDLFWRFNSTSGDNGRRIRGSARRLARLQGRLQKQHRTRTAGRCFRGMVPASPPMTDRCRPETRSRALPGEERTNSVIARCYNP